VRYELTMPTLGYDMETGKIESWVKAVGDVVERGEPIAEIETDKATVEMESPVGGVLIEILHPAGAEVAVGVVIAYLETES
jgi:pyruvate/2-oxoglutarate dehydrogenase complex dihydrolipoamide acyltransferase (E2) component